ncbi:MAG: fused MFS/spermidine synthase [Acidobacteriia bacterium]|nr:fused MFS/spermidine synthase [Terriglobia bacterium]
MASQSISPPARAAGSRIPLLLLILFAGSGCSALIYEIVWFQLLQLAIGSTTVSMGVLLATYMGGLCIGSIGLPRLALARKHPLRVYAVLEAGIALFGLLALFEIPAIDRVYFAGATSGLPGMLLRGLIAAVCLLPPTILMGASLPAIVRWIESTPRGVSWWALLYGGNTVGAVAGCLAAGFYLLRIYDTYVATYVAAAINVLVALASFALASRAPMPDVRIEDRARGPWPVYITIGLSGACALGAEVIWTRLLGMMLGSTVYVFSIILAVFLIGLALGSGGASWLVRVKPGPIAARQALGWCQILLAVAIAWTAYMIANWLPFLPSDTLTSGMPWQTFRIDLVRCLFAILPPTLLWGASFPLACAAAATAGPHADSGRVVGGIYAANTLGAIAGALSVSLVLVPWIGTQQSTRLLLVVSALSALFVLVAQARQRASRAAGLAVSVVGACLLVFAVDAIPGKVIAYGRRAATAAGQVVYTEEGRNSSVAITMWPDGATEVDVNGHVEATTEPYDMKLQRMVGHLPALLHPHPQSVLGIGFGAGVSAGTFTRYPTIQKITVCEIEPVIPPTSTRYFSQQDYNVLHNPRTRMVYDDARHFILTTTEKFDIIASDPLDVFVKGTAAIYSQEYFEAVKQHLNPGGMFSLYVPLYETDEATIKSELATFFLVFPNGTVWGNTRDGAGYDMVFMGQAEPLRINLDEVEQRLGRPDYAPVAESLREVGTGSATELLSTYAGQKPDLDPWIRGAQINQDRNLRLQYLGGWGINSQMANYLYDQILHYRRPPVSLISGSPERMRSLLSAMYGDSGGR